MRILADSKLSYADSITATNSKSFADESKLITYQLVDKMECTNGTTKITIDFGSQSIDVNSVCLCGTNISPSAAMTLSYSDTDPNTPEDTIILPIFTSFNQVWFLSEVLQKRYWVIDIVDPSPQDSSGVEIGHIQIGEYTQLDGAVFPSEPSMNIFDSPARSATRQPYGSKGVVADDHSFSIQTDGAGAKVLLDIIRDKQRIEPVVWVPFEYSLDNPLYPPRYGVNTEDSYPYAVDGAFDLFLIPIKIEETF